MVNFQSTPGLMEQNVKQVVSHFSSMSSNKLKFGAISSPVISAGLVLFYQPPSGASAKCAFSWNRSILEIVWICSDRLKKKKAGTEEWSRGEGLGLYWVVWAETRLISPVSLLSKWQPITEKDDSQLWPYASNDLCVHWSQRWWMVTWRHYLPLSILSSSFLSYLCGLRCFRLARLLKTKLAKAQWELLGLCQSQGSVWACKSRWKDGGS